MRLACSWPSFVARRDQGHGTGGHIPLGTLLCISERLGLYATWLWYLQATTRVQRFLESIQNTYASGFVPGVNENDEGISLMCSFSLAAGCGLRDRTCIFAILS